MKSTTMAAIITLFLAILAIPAFDQLVLPVNFWRSLVSHRWSHPSRSEILGPVPLPRLSNDYFYELAGTPYFTPLEHVSGTLKVSSAALPSTGSLRPLTVMHATSAGGHSTSATLDTTIVEYLEDDVFSASFLENILLLHEEPIDTIILEKAFLAGLDRWGVKNVFLPNHAPLEPASQKVDSHVKVHLVQIKPINQPAGPYLASIESDNIHLFSVYRLYPDTSRAFLYGMYPLNDGSGAYQSLKRMDDYGNVLIPVPTRIACPRDNAIRGRRIAVKDIYNIKGVTTGGGSRTRAKLYGPMNETASSIRKLEDLGGAVVGKVKTAAMVSRGSDNDDTLDEQYPFSPRADGWQSCAASSSGSACAMVSYDWLDIALGSDTGGSIRMPAAFQGLYGNRPTTGIIALDGVLPWFSYADTPGLFVRDPVLFSSSIKAWYSDSPLDLAIPTALPDTILLSRDYVRQGSEAAQKVIDVFIDDMARTSGMTIREVSLEDILARSGYDRARLETISRRWVHADWWASWPVLGKPFFDDFAALHDGEQPIIDPVPRFIWDCVKNHTEWGEEYESTIQDREDFKASWEQHVLPRSSRACSESIFLYDIGIGGLPSYREASLNDGTHGNGVPAFFNHRNHPIPSNFLAPITGSPDYTIPIGQAPFVSNATGRTEMKTLTISLMAHPGCDFMLLDVIERLSEAGVIKAVKTGRTAF